MCHKGNPGGYAVIRGRKLQNVLERYVVFCENLRYGGHRAGLVDNIDTDAVDASEILDKIDFFRHPFLIAERHVSVPSVLMAGIDHIGDNSGRRRHLPRSLTVEHDISYRMSGNKDRIEHASDGRERMRFGEHRRMHPDFNAVPVLFPDREKLDLVTEHLGEIEVFLATSFST